MSITTIIRRLALTAGTGALLALPTSAAGQDWSSAQRLDSLPGSAANLLTGAIEGCASMTPDLTTFYFTSNREGSFAIYRATRKNAKEGFANVAKLPAPINAAGSNNSCPSTDGANRLYFTSTRDGHEWGDLYVSNRRGSGWTEPVNLGPLINGPGLEETPTFTTDDQGCEVMIFTRRPAGTVYPFAGPGTLMQSVNGGAPSAVPGSPNEGGDNNRAWISRDGLTLWWDSARGGGNDIYVARRSSLSAPWGSATAVTAVNSPALDLRPFVSPDGRFMLLSSNREGSSSPAPDIWFSTRSRRVEAGGRAPSN